MFYRAWGICIRHGASFPSDHPNCTSHKLNLKFYFSLSKFPAIRNCANAIQVRKTQVYSHVPYVYLHTRFVPTLVLFFAHDTTCVLSLSLHFPTSLCLSKYLLLSHHN